MYVSKLYGMYWFKKLIANKINNFAEFLTKIYENNLRINNFPNFSHAYTNIKHSYYKILKKKFSWK